MGLNCDDHKKCTYHIMLRGVKDRVKDGCFATTSNISIMKTKNKRNAEILTHTKKL